MSCALCLQDNALRDSHIIPEFLYEPLYDEKHRLQLLSTVPETKNSMEQKGLRESLLCDDCEQKISVWEGYARRALKGGTPINFKNEGDIVHVSGLDYQKFRLFQLSILWRTGVSTLPFFQKVQLGRHAERLRQLLLNSDPGAPNRYTCIMIGLRYEKGILTDLIMQPVKTKFFGHTSYRFVFGGFLWFFVVSSHDLQAQFTQATLRPNGSALIFVRNALEIQDVTKFAKQIIQMGREP